jgi:hypothetical protein
MARLPGKLGFIVRFVAIFAVRIVPKLFYKAYASRRYITSAAYVGLIGDILIHLIV